MQHGVAQGISTLNLVRTRLKKNIYINTSRKWHEFDNCGVQTVALYLILMYVFNKKLMLHDTPSSRILYYPMEELYLLW